MSGSVTVVEINKYAKYIHICQTCTRLFKVSNNPYSSVERMRCVGPRVCVY